MPLLSKFLDVAMEERIDAVLSQLAGLLLQQSHLLDAHANGVSTCHRTLYLQAIMPNYKWSSARRSHWYDRCVRCCRPLLIPRCIFILIDHTSLLRSSARFVLPTIVSQQASVSLESLQCVTSTTIMPCATNFQYLASRRTPVEELIKCH
jgi:hypothetical protein